MDPTNEKLSGKLTWFPLWLHFGRCRMMRTTMLTDFLTNGNGNFASTVIRSWQGQLVLQPCWSCPKTTPPLALLAFGENEILCLSRHQNIALSDLSQRDVNQPRYSSLQPWLISSSLCPPIFDCRMSSLPYPLSPLSLLLEEKRRNEVLLGRRARNKITIEPSCTC